MKLHLGRSRATAAAANGICLVPCLPLWYLRTNIHDHLRRRHKNVAVNAEAAAAVGLVACPCGQVAANLVGLTRHQSAAKCGHALPPPAAAPAAASSATPPNIGDSAAPADALLATPPNPGDLVAPLVTPPNTGDWAAAEELMAPQANLMKSLMQKTRWQDLLHRQTLKTRQQGLLRCQTLKTWRQGLLRRQTYEDSAARLATPPNIEDSAAKLATSKGFWNLGSPTFFVQVDR